MSDRITVNTDKMAGFVRELQRMSDKLNDNASSLRRADFSECGGGGVVDYQRISLKCSGRTVSGSRAPSLVDSFADGLTATGSYVSTLARHVQEVLSRFEEAENEIVAIGEGEEATADAAFAAYKSDYVSVRDMMEKNKAKWERDDTFIDTAYDKAVKAALSSLILNDPDFSQASWNRCTTNQEKEALLRRVMEKFSEAMGTTLTGGLYFTTAQSGTAGTVQVTKPDGTTESITLSDTAGAAYWSDLDCIVVRLDSADYAELVATIAHENRHNLQSEVVSTEVLKDSKYVLSESEYEKLAQEVADWAEEFAQDGYFTYENSDIQTRSEEIHEELGFWEKLLLSKEDEKKNARIYAAIELHKRYAEQSIEVDARYMEDYVRLQMVMRSMADAIPTHSMFIRGGTGRGGGGGGGR